MLNNFVYDLISTTQTKIETLGVASVEHVRAQSEPLLGFSPAVLTSHLQLKKLLRHCLYQHPQVVDMAKRSKTIVEELFATYTATPSLLPGAMTGVGPEPLAQSVADYIAGMTDRFAIAEHARITSA